jgi:hypothetical protein
VNADEFYELTEEDQYLALAGMTDDESRALRHELLAAGHEHAYARAATARSVMGPHVRPGHVDWAARCELETHYAAQRRHRASGQHALANANAKKEGTP